MPSHSDSVGTVVEDRVLLVRALQVVVGDARAEVVDVVEADVAGAELQHPRQLQVGAAAQRRLGVAPVLAALPVGVLELVLDVEQPDPGRAGEQRGQPDDEQVVAPADQPAQRRRSAPRAPRWSRSRCGACAGARRGRRCAGRSPSRRSARCRTSRAGCASGGRPGARAASSAWYSLDGQRVDVADAATLEVAGGGVVDRVVVLPAHERR